MVGTFAFFKNEQAVFGNVREISFNATKKLVVKDHQKESFVTLSNILDANTLPHLRLSLIAIPKNTTCNQVLQKQLIRCIFETWGQLNYL